MSLKDLSDREVSHILAALRLMQSSRPCGHEVENIATSEGDHSLMDTEEIDRLCERLNVSKGDTACDDCITDVVEALLNHVKRQCDDTWADILSPKLEARKFHAQIQASLASATDYLDMYEHLACLFYASFAMLSLGRLIEVQMGERR